MNETYRIQDICQGFRLEANGDIPLMNARYWKWVHEKSGAVVYQSDRDDGQLLFSIGFRTLPEDDTGVFHILEHSCLDGSESFRLKEPFVNLMKTSMAVDLNAMTFGDKTVYYFITTNPVDYSNMMRVYLDAVFHPLLLTDRRIFEKEAWHLEPDGDGGVRCNGVVFNEMQAHAGMPDVILWHELERKLFPDTCYSHNSGGDPQCIHDLTYEQFCDTYKRFYSASNAAVYVSGHIDTEAVLRQLDGVLCGVEDYGMDRPAPVSVQTPVVCADSTVTYQPGEDDEASTRMVYACVLGDGNQREIPLAFNILSRYLSETLSSPLTRAVLDADVGQDFSMIGAVDEYRQPFAYFYLGKADPAKAEAFRQVILDTLRRLVNEGLDHRRLVDLIDDHEVICRRKSLQVSTGFSIMEDFLRHELQKGVVDPVNGLDLVRKQLEEDPCYFEHLIEDYLLNSNHWCMVKCVPSETRAEEDRARMEAWLTDRAEELRREGAYEALEQHVQAFNDYLGTPDDPEAVASVPHLCPTDLTSRPSWQDMAEETLESASKERAITSLFYKAETNGMASAGWLLDVTDVPFEKLVWLPCMSQALFELPTSVHGVEELTDEWVRLKAGHSVGIQHIKKGLSAEDNRIYVNLNLNLPAEYVSDGMKLLSEYMTSFVADQEILKRLFSNSAATKENMIWSGNQTARQVAEGQLSASGLYEQNLIGLGQYAYRKALAERFDNEAQNLMDGLRYVADVCLSCAKPIAYFIGDEKAYDAWKQSVQAFPFAKAGVLPAASLPDPEGKHVGLSITGEVNYCAEVFRLSDVGASYSPRMDVVTSDLCSRYLWDEVRAKGGAYGAGTRATRYGLLVYSSYRDPRVKDTYEAYHNAATWIRANLPEQGELDGLIVSSLSGYYAPAGPFDQGNRALNRYLMGMTAADKLMEIDAILGTTVDDFCGYARMLEALAESGKGIRVALGGRTALEASGLFDRISEL